MGMTIDEAKKVIQKMLAYTDLTVRANLNADMIDACNFAVEIMRKYQKIQEITAKRPKDMISSNPTLRAISEVLKDGNVD